MAVVNEKSSQIVKLDSDPRVELEVREAGGKLRTYRFDHTRAVAGDATSTVDLCKLPAGARVLAGASYYRNTAGGAALTQDMGTRSHINAQTGATVAASAARFQSAVDVAAAGFRTLAADGQMTDDQDILLGEAVVFITTAGAAAPVGYKVTGEIVVAVE